MCESKKEREGENKRGCYLGCVQCRHHVGLLSALQMSCHCSECSKCHIRHKVCAVTFSKVYQREGQCVECQGPSRV